MTRGAGQSGGEMVREECAMIKKGIWILVGLVVFALNWAALHDILKGREPDLRAEYAVVILTAVGLLGYAIIRILRARKGETGRQ